MSDVELDYDFLTQRALKSVVKDVLSMTAELGEAPGEHHFFIEFETTAEGVTIPDRLIEAYPVRMTIVLQHQFGNLTVDDEKFGVTLWFKGIETRLEIPFDAVTSFADPSVKFGLRFDVGLGEDVNTVAESEQTADNADEAEAEKDTSGDVVELDAFRKK